MSRASGYIQMKEKKNLKLKWFLIILEDFLLYMEQKKGIGDMNLFIFSKHFVEDHIEIKSIMLARNEKKIFFVWFLVRQTNYKLIKKQ